MQAKIDYTTNEKTNQDIEAGPETQLTAQRLDQIKKDAMEALKSIGAKHGVAFQFRGGRYTNQNAILKIEVACINDEGQAETELRTNFKEMAWQFGLKPEDLDRTFRYGDATYTIVGCRRHAKRNPIVARNGDGKPYSFAAAVVKGHLQPKGPGSARPQTPIK